VAAKAAAAYAAGLSTIICIGETQAQRSAGDADSVCRDQLAQSLPDGLGPESFAIAYEPVWAIGTGRAATPQDIAVMHTHIRACLNGRLGAEGAKVRILYGGSLKPDNAAEILGIPEVGGTLVGGASLKAADFLSIIFAASGT
jgi:triosephosphate isomerase